MGIEGSEIQKLYIRLPVKIRDEVVIRDLHPNIIQVHLPRQKSRRWCVVDFENKEKLKKAIEDLKKLKINNKKIKVKAYKGEPANKNKKVSPSQADTTKSLENLLQQN